jgi:hypothetical protein
LSFLLPTEDEHEGNMTMEIVKDINIKMGAFAIQLSVLEAFLTAIVQEGKIYLQSQQESSLFLHFSTIAIHRMKPSILTRASYRGVSGLVRRSKQNNVNFGRTVLTCLSF